MRRIVVFGAYKTGTTALFYKVKRSLPGEPRTLFEAREYVPEPGDETRPVLAKVILGIHDPSAAVRYEGFLPFERKLYLTRDPRDWLVSGILFLVQQERQIYDDDHALNRVLELLEAKEAAPRAVSARRLLEAVTPGRTLEATRDWMREHCRWLADFDDRLRGHLTVRYEALVDGACDAALGDYLGLTIVPGAASVDPEHDHVPRTRGHGAWRHWLHPEDVEFFRPAFADYLRRYGYPEDWTLDPDPVVRPEHASGYVRRVVAKRRAARA